MTASSARPAAAAAARDAYDRVAAILAAENVEPISEKVYGTLAARDAIFASRRDAFLAHGLDPALPATFLDGAPAAGGELAGIQVWGVRSRSGPGAVTSVPGGRLWRGASHGFGPPCALPAPHTFRVLHLASMRGPAGAAPAEQGRQMFASAAAAAAASGFSYASTVRTWIWLRRLLDWYGDLNRVRSDFYRAYDFALPASTGIQAKSGDEECVMDLLLADGLQTTMIDRSTRQGPASAYGSSFSRGLVIDYEGTRRPPGAARSAARGRTVHVSGTASIDTSGNSVHQGDPSAQFVETLLDVAAVLQEAGMTLADVVQATLFCKDARTWAACREAQALLGIPRFPTVGVIADVCRKELLVEMEAVASR